MRFLDEVVSVEREKGEDPTHPFLDVCFRFVDVVGRLTPVT